MVFHFSIYFLDHRFDSQHQSAHNFSGVTIDDPSLVQATPCAMAAGVAAGPRVQALSEPVRQRQRLQHYRGHSSNEGAKGLENEVYGTENEVYGTPRSCHLLLVEFNPLLPMFDHV